ncbi:hypothetical protein RND81_02G220900 [Saponaria officinalis]|uniref:Uncharacterized protein n=1 Tax=Saponaria officinalis TaxID=3572 RepID=A0AAW1MZJ2_SAPOF
MYSGQGPLGLPLALSLITMVKVNYLWNYLEPNRRNYLSRRTYLHKTEIQARRRKQGSLRSETEKGRTHQRGRRRPLQVRPAYTVDEKAVVLMMTIMIGDGERKRKEK